MARRVGLEYQESISAHDVNNLSNESAIACRKEKKMLPIRFAPKINVIRCWWPHQ